MNPNRSEPPDDSETVYSIEILAELAGISPRTVIRYHELGVISPANDQLQFSAEDLRQLRRLEHLRHTHDLTESGLKLISQLLTDLEKLQHQLRQLSR